jgi:hypothetical protein
LKETAESTVLCLETVVGRDFEAKDIKVVELTADFQEL